VRRLKHRRHAVLGAACLRPDQYAPFRGVKLPQLLMDLPIDRAAQLDILDFAGGCVTPIPNMIRYGAFDDRYPRKEKIGAAMKERSDIRINSRSSEKEINSRRKLYELFADCPIPSTETLANLGLFINRQAWSRFFFLHDLYELIIPINGIVVEFGVRWGQNLALFSSLRGTYEPFNYGRKIVGFDTFAGFPSVSEQDGANAAPGAYGVTPNYQDYLEKILAYHEAESPLEHIKKYELVKGDATVTLEKYLNDHPETIIALAYFDLDIYEPTKRCLELIQNHLTKGSVVGFDDLNSPVFPGETLALKEVWSLRRYAIRRSPYTPRSSYIVVE
jgi:hypothetical protein